MKAVDRASDVIEGVASKTQRSLGQVENASKKVDKSSKQVALAFNNVATSGFALYNAVDRVMDMQVQVDRANLAVKTSLNAIEDAQRRYTDAVEKHGASSEEALSAQKDLELAQERYQVACERSEMMQGNLNEAMFQSALTVIPSLITMITSISTITSGWTAITHGASVALTFLAANPVVLVIAAIAGLVAAIIWLSQNWETVCNGLTAAWNAFVGGLTWVWEHVLKPVFDAIWTAIKPLVDAISYILGFGGEAEAKGGEARRVPTGPTLPPSPFTPTPGGGQGPTHGQFGGLITRPTLLFAGEAGPEALIPLPAGVGGGITLQITGPLVNVEGSADRKTAEFAVNLVREELKSVLVEASSSGAVSTHKRIRM